MAYRISRRAFKGIVVSLETRCYRAADVGAKYPCLVRAVTFGRVTRTTMRRQAPSRRLFLEVYPIVYWLDSSS